MIDKSCISLSSFAMSKYWIKKGFLKGGGSVVVDLLFIVSPIVGVCNCSMFCCALLCATSGFAVVLVVCLPGVSWLLRGSSSPYHGFV